MKFFVWWSTGPYEGQNFDEFETEAEVLELLNRYASITQFTFTVVWGKEVKFKPVNIVKAYERDQ